MKFNTIKFNIKIAFLFFVVNASNAVSQNDSLINSFDSLKQVVEMPFFDVDKDYSTSAVSTITSRQIFRTPTANISNTLYGLSPGLYVNQGSGEPGNDNAWMLIRGLGSYNGGDIAIYIDGFQSNLGYLRYLSQNEIESISVVKDAAALSVLGVKGANGALWVTTKRGHNGSPSIEFNTRVGLKEPLNLYKPLASREYAILYNEAKSNDNNRVWSPVYNGSELDKLTDVDWYNEVLNENTMYTSYDVSLKGGGENIQFFTLLGYTGDKGFYNVKKDDTHSNVKLDLYNIRTNLNFKILKIFEGKVDIGGRIEKRFRPNYSTGDLWKNLARYPNNIYPVKNENGTWTGTAVHPDNPLASITDVGYVSFHDRLLQTNLSLKEDLGFLVKGLYLAQGISFSTWTRGTYNVTRNYTRFINDVKQTSDEDTNYEVYDDYGTNQWSWQQFTATLGYNREFNNSVLTSAINYLQYTYNIDQNINGSAGPHTTYAHQNVAARVNLVHQKKYIGELALAYSGSDNFKKDNRFNFYPAVSAGWIISAEPFFAVSNINLFKLRASVGKVGYDGFSGGRYLYQPYYISRRSFLMGNGETPETKWGLEPLYTANSEIGPENSYKVNIGFDLALLKKLSFSMDGFLDKRGGIVTYDNSLPGSTGTIASYRNVGKVTTKGLEIAVSFADNINKFKYLISGNTTIISDKINYMAEVTQTSPNSALTGHPIGTRFGYDAIGFYQVEDFNNGVLNSEIPKPSFGEVQPGDIKYRDVNEDNIVDNRDMIKIGNPYIPRIMYAINIELGYNNLDFKVLMQGIGGRDLNLLDYWDKVIPFENNSTAYEMAKGRWAYYPDQGIDTRADATFPRLSLVGNSNNYIPSTFWTKSGDFFRVRNIELGYTLPSNLFRDTLKSLRIYFTAVNPFTLSSFLRNYRMDPESPVGYPGSKSYNVGLTVNF